LAPAHPTRVAARIISLGGSGESVSSIQSSLRYAFNHPLEVMGDVAPAFGGSPFGFASGEATIAAESAEVTGPALARQLGVEGEQAVGITGPKVGVRIPGSNQLRFPDGLDLETNTLSEIKNVGSQGLTQQLKDYVAYSQSNGMSFDLYVRGPLSPQGQTYLTQPLADAVRAGNINLKFIPGTF
jgi:hypothetical protein